jgi:hypothetical protein
MPDLHHPLPAFPQEATIPKVRAAACGWNTRNPLRALLAYTADGHCPEFVSDQQEIVAVLIREWAKELGCRLVGGSGYGGPGGSFRAFRFLALNRRTPVGPEEAIMNDRDNQSGGKHQKIAHSKKLQVKEASWQHSDDRLDEALRDTFPASDPVSIVQNADGN